ncbi:Zn-ribbon domain-containing OB-fold protein [Amycolatopsis jejuensis]|uniref:Zn-ribbon domain-containing OB-fold protein n=1 Tax=Amycolatopsis jejuensis TaxID=330084 RepID=UPI0005251821|nr:Zn-ribbon domain-containing OB-fold protein [Amycolatopsis jejuensis]
MTEPALDERFEDPTTKPYWDGARAQRLLLQQCLRCGNFQLYPRPFCLQCGAGDLEWVEAAGSGRVYSKTTVHLRTVEHLDPPYVVALVELTEGPRILTNIAGSVPVSIGDRVRVAWRHRPAGPPVPVFEPLPPEPTQR